MNEWQPDHKTENPLEKESDINIRGSEYITKLKESRVGSGSLSCNQSSQGLWLGSGSFDNAPFRVNMAGAMTALSGVTSGTFQTATSGQRITIDGSDNDIKLYDSSDRIIVRIGTDGQQQIRSLVYTDDYHAIYAYNANTVALISSPLISFFVQNKSVGGTGTSTVDTMLVSNYGTGVGVNISTVGTGAQLRLQKYGSNPTTLVDGDMWHYDDKLYFRSVGESKTVAFEEDIDSSLAIYGDGSDGDATNPAAPTRDMYYNNLTISGGTYLNTSGYRIFVKGTLTLSGSSWIGRPGNNGGNGSNASDHVGAAAGAAADALANGNLAGALAGKIGSVGGDGGTGANPGENAKDGTESTALSHCGGPSGAKSGSEGGNGGAGWGGAGGDGLGNTNPGGRTGATNFSKGLPINILMLDLAEGDNAFIQTSPMPGATSGGGGGGGGDASTKGGGGGGGGGSGSPGGVVVICAKDIVIGSGSSITVAGGNGGNGGNGAAGQTRASDAAGGGGGGGGGAGGNGGILTLIYNSLTNDGTITVAGGTGGTGGTGGAAGGTGGSAGENGAANNNGNAGLLIQIQN